MSDPIDWLNPKNHRRFLEQFQELSRSLDLLKNHVPSEAQFRDMAKRFGLDLEQLHSILASQLPGYPTLPYRLLPNWTQTQPTLSTQTPEPKQTSQKRSFRWEASIGSASAVRRVEAFIKANGMSMTEFASRAGTTDRTLRKFRKTGRIKRAIFDGIAEAMGVTRDELLKS